MNCLRGLPTCSLAALLIIIFGCTKSYTDTGQIITDDTKLILSGSSTIGPLASEIGKRYEKLNPGVRVDVQTGGSSRGITEATTGLADIGMSSRSLKESEEAGRIAWPIAMDGVCFIVHASNPIGELTKSQLASILRGDVKNWKELGGADKEIVFINRAAGRSELELVSRFFGVDASEMNADLIVGENQHGIKSVANEANAISYMSVGASEEAIRIQTPIRMLPLGGIEASSESVESAAFPLSRPLILVTSDHPNEAVKRFIRYAQSSNVADLVRKLSYVPISN